MVAIRSTRTDTARFELAVMNEGGNWSVGQKQLLCLGRAFLKRAKIMVLDEASASVDARTDGLIQSAIRAGLAESTVINVAHRIPTIVHSDRVLVLQAGRVREHDAPRTLMANPESLFRSMVREFGAQSSR